MAKKQKIARVRYEEEKTAEKDGYNAPEAFVLEIETPDGWGLVVRANLTRSVKWPDAEEKEFIHWQFIDEMCKLIRAGYYIHR